MNERESECRSIKLYLERERLVEKWVAVAVFRRRSERWFLGGKQAHFDVRVT